MTVELLLWAGGSYALNLFVPTDADHAKPMMIVVVNVEHTVD